MRRLFIPLIVILLAVSLMELSARIVVASGLTLDNETFRAERLAMARGDLWRYDQNVYTPDDYTGYYFNVHDGYRVTVGQPSEYQRTIWLFGSSTTFDTAVADKYTLASQLQAFTADRVVNVGMWAASTTLQVIRLRTMPIQAGDIVIFYNGLTDANGPAYASLIPICGYKVNLATARLICDASIGDPIIVKRAVDDYRRAVQQARAYVTARGASFVNVLQPYYWSIPNPGPADYTAEQVGRAERAVWPLLQASGVVDLDLTHVLDKVRVQRELFVETQHVGEEANRIIVAAIWRYLSIF